MRLFSLRTAVTAVGLAGLLAGATACGDDEAGRADGATTASGPEGGITVLAAASLTDAFDEVGAAFTEAHPGTDVEMSYGGSSDLREQVLAGSPADVFASADTSNMDAVVEAGAVTGDPEVFATNSLAIAVPAGNGAGVEGLEAFGDEGLFVGLCAEEVPCGESGREALAAAGVAPAQDTDEPDVRSLLDKVASGELDAGIVYVTDVASAGDAVEGIAIPEGDDVVADYPIATLAGAPEPEVAEAFVAFVLSDEGRAILGSYGFVPPS
jgi:molybdate transport system substrate-binding protein